MARCHVMYFFWLRICHYDLSVLSATLVHLRKANTELSRHFRKANTEPSMHLGGTIHNRPCIFGGTMRNSCLANAWQEFPLIYLLIEPFADTLGQEL